MSGWVEMYLRFDEPPWGPRVGEYIEVRWTNLNTGKPESRRRKVTKRMVEHRSFTWKVREGTVGYDVALVSPMRQVEHCTACGGRGELVVES
jgi:hypothetical protein